MKFVGEIKAHHAFKNHWFFTETDSNGDDVICFRAQCQLGEPAQIIQLLTEMTREQRKEYFVVMERLRYADRRK